MNVMGDVLVEPPDSSLRENGGEMKPLNSPPLGKYFVLPSITLNLPAKGSIRPHRNKPIHPTHPHNLE